MNAPSRILRFSYWRWSFPLILIVLSIAAGVRTQASAGGTPEVQTKSDMTSEGIAAPLTLQWKTGRDENAASLPPVYSGGVVYYAAGPVLHAVRAADGSSLWTYKGGASFVSPPALDKDGLYIGASDSQVYKVSLKDGSLIWSHAVAAPIKARPVISNGCVYVGSDDGNVLALNTATGAPVWSFQTGGGSCAAMTVDGDLFVTAENHKLFRLNSQTGRLEWQIALAEVPTAPVFAFGAIYVAAGRDLYIVDPQRGAVRHDFQLSATITAAPGVSSSSIFVTTDDNRLVAFTDAGSQIWTADIGENCTTPPLVEGNMVLVSTQRGILWMYDTQNGSLRWDYVLHSKEKGGRVPLVGLADSAGENTALYALATDGSLSAFQAKAGGESTPIISNTYPLPGASVSPADVAFAATVADDGCGIFPNAVTLTVDGAVVNSVLYSAPHDGVLESQTTHPDKRYVLQDGPHTATLKATNWAGNTVTKTWNFTVVSNAVTALHTAATPDSANQNLDANGVSTVDNPLYPYPAPPHNIAEKQAASLLAKKIFNQLQKQYEEQGGSPPPPVPPY